MALQFTDAAITNLPEIVAIYNSTVAGRMVTADTEPVTVASKEPWFYAHHAKRPLWMITDADKTIGWASFQDFYGRPAYNGTAEISIYLHENARGKGYGKAVLQYAMQQCHLLGIKDLLGFIFEHNLPSIALFEKQGFEQWAKLPNIAVLDGIERSLMIVGKRLTPNL